MKHNYLIVIIVFFFVIPANAQWITLYEGGQGTDQNLRFDWESGFFFGPDGSGDDGVLILGLNTVDNDCRMFCYYSPFGTGAAAIYKKIPEMANYASLRVKLRMHLPDTVGTIDYYALNLDGNGQAEIGTVDNSWNHFGSNVLDEYVYLSNTNGDSSVYFRTDLLRADSVRFSYDHVLIEADTTQMLNINIPPETTFAIYSFGSQINIAPSNYQESYEYSVTSMSGNEILQGETTGNIHIAEPMDAGIYFVTVKSKSSTLKQKVYLN